MKYTENEMIKQTTETLKGILKNFNDYDELVSFFDNGKGLFDGYGYSINEFWDGDAKEFYGIDGSDGFDLDFGLMGFTIYRDGKNGIKLNENASYYVYNEQEDDTDVIDIEL